MKILRPLGSVVVLSLLLSALVAPGHAASPLRKNPASKVFISTVEGLAEVNTGEKIEVLSDKAVYSAQGTAFFTKDKGRNSMVFSNGTGVYLDVQTQLEVRRFVQEPFVPNRTDPDSEPSISTMQLFLSRGTLGICTSRLVAGSSMTYQTPHATIAVRGRKLYIEVTETYTKVFLLEGDVTVRGGGEIDMGGQVLKPGQQAYIPLAEVGSPAKISLSDITDDDMKTVDERVAIACMARNTVYFDVGATDAGEAEIQAIPTAPGELPSNNTISNAVIGTPPAP